LELDQAPVLVVSRGTARIREDVLGIDAGEGCIETRK
jgi:hypothetical protein